jgi:LysR family hydrogen peroxide-inducible transcriptional activator
MNIQQFQYIIALSECKHFETAADQCCISQSTLSTMISKFEDEIGIRIFDRKKKPVELTREGEILIEQIRLITKDIDQLMELSKELKGELSGTIHLSVIPTVAPFLLPIFLHDFASTHPQIRIVVREETTDEIQRKLKTREIDLGIISTSLNDKELMEYHLYDEAFLLYDAKERIQQPVDIPSLLKKELCLMEEGHCMRTQIMELCQTKQLKQAKRLGFEYKAGSIDSLRRFVKRNQLTTLLPYLSTIDFSEEEQAHLSTFASPIPYRSIGIAVHRHYVKKQLLHRLQEMIKEKIKPILPTIGEKDRMLSPV